MFLRTRYPKRNLKEIKEQIMQISSFQAETTNVRASGGSKLVCSKNSTVTGKEEKEGRG